MFLNNSGSVNLVSKYTHTHIHTHVHANKQTQHPLTPGEPAWGITFLSLEKDTQLTKFRASLEEEQEEEQQQQARVVRKIVVSMDRVVRMMEPE